MSHNNDSSSHKLNYYEKVLLKQLSHTKPELNLADFYQGSLVATGITCHPLGFMKRRFTASVSGEKKEGLLTLEEKFTYDDGRRFDRQWSLIPLNENMTEFKGTGADILGEIYGVSSGCAALLKYTLRVPQKGGRHRTIDVNHWQWQIDERKTIHKITLSKWMIPIVKSTVIFEKLAIS